MKQIESDLREAVIAVLSDMLAGLTNAPQPHSAPKRPEAVTTGTQLVSQMGSPVEPEWSGLVTAEPPAPDATPPQKVAPPWPEGECPRHHKEWRQGQFGVYCATKEDDKRYANRKGYCALEPGKVYAGRLIPRLAA